MVKKENKWIIPQSMITGMGVLLGAMIVPQIRKIVVDTTSKVSNMIGLK